MEAYVIKAPSESTLQILKRRSGIRWPEDFRPSALGLVQGRFIDMMMASDLAEKTVGVFVSDVNGSCPQNMILLVIAGETAAVNEAIAQIQARNGGGKTW